MKRLLALAGLMGSLALAGSAFAASAGAAAHPPKMFSVPLWFFGYHGFWD